MLTLNTVQLFHKRYLEEFELIMTHWVEECINLLSEGYYRLLWINVTNLKILVTFSSSVYTQMLSKDKY